MIYSQERSEVFITNYFRRARELQVWRHKKYMSSSKLFKIYLHNKNKKSLRRFSPGQAMVESVISFFLLISFLFAAMDLAMIANCVFILHDVAQAAARAAAVRQNSTMAATTLLLRTIGIAGSYGEFGGVSISRRNVTSSNYIGVSLTDPSRNPVNVITAEVRYFYKPFFAFTPIMRRIPLRVTYRIMEEPPLPQPGSS